MKKVAKYLFIIIVITATAAALFIKPAKRDTDGSKISIVTTNFPTYDFARAITKDTDVNLSMLLAPGSDLHDYEPTPQDILAIKNSDVFIYIGGESEEWIEDIVQDIDNNYTKTIKLMDFSQKIEENHEKTLQNDDEEENEESETDEHIWTSIKNSIILIKAISSELSQKYPQNADIYAENSEKYIELLQNTDKKLEKLTQNHTGEKLIFADRFPLAYFFNDYGLDYLAAFPGCAHETEASIATIAQLESYIKSHNIKYIYTIELSDQKIAKTISDSTGAEILELNSAHNISAENFQNGLTYAEIMENNYKILEKSLK